MYCCSVPFFPSPCPPFSSLCWPAASLIDVECDRVNNWTFLIIVIKAAILCVDSSCGGNWGLVVSTTSSCNSITVQSRESLTVLGLICWKEGLCVVHEFKLC